MQKFTTEEYWKAIILYGLNASTYKIAFGKTLISLCAQGITKATWELLSFEFLKQYQERLMVDEPMPQLSLPSRRTEMERIVESMRYNLSLDAAITEVGKEAFRDVIVRFHNLSGITDVLGMFYRYQDGKFIELTDEMHLVYQNHLHEVLPELDARWSLLEGAFSMAGHDYILANDIRSIYLQDSTKRKNLTSQIPFLQGYQGNICFYCGEHIEQTDCHVDHVLPRQVIQNDEIWNLVLAHNHCNLSKLDSIVGIHYIEKLHKRNENIMKSNHPWKKKIESSLGSNQASRKTNLLRHYENVRNVIGANRYWGGIPNYRPESDPFYKKFITQVSLTKSQGAQAQLTKSLDQTGFDF